MGWRNKGSQNLSSQVSETTQSVSLQWSSSLAITKSVQPASWQCWRHALTSAICADTFDIENDNQTTSRFHSACHSAADRYCEIDCTAYTHPWTDIVTLRPQSGEHKAAQISWATDIVLIITLNWCHADVICVHSDHNRSVAVSPTT